VEDVALYMESINILFCALHRGGSAILAQRIAKPRKGLAFCGKNGCSILGGIEILNCYNN